MKPRLHAPSVRATSGSVAPSVALLALLCLGGCRTLAPRLVPPTLAVTAVRLQGGGLRHEQVQLQVHVSNPNDRTISVRSIVANVDLAGMPFASGTSEAPFTLPANGDTSFVLDVTADVSRALLVMAGGLGHRTVAYHLYGELHLQHSLVRTIHFAHDGRVRL